MQGTRAIADYHGPVYMRMLRGRVKRVFDPGTHRFELGKANLLRKGKAVALISTGIMTDRALQAAEILRREGIEPLVLHVPTVKPLDEQAILEAASDTRRVLTLENHSIIGGLGSAVSDALARAGLSVAFAKVGIPDQFTGFGSIASLTDKYGLTVQHVVKAARKVMEASPPR
jgi:transketolase